MKQPTTEQVKNFIYKKVFVSNLDSARWQDKETISEEIAKKYLEIDTFWGDAYSVWRENKKSHTAKNDLAFWNGFNAGIGAVLQILGCDLFDLDNSEE